MEQYGRPGPQRTSSPAVTFLNERPKSLSFSSAFKPPGVSRDRSEDEFPQIILPDRTSSNQQQNQQQPPPLHQRPASSRFLNRPQSSSGVRRQKSFEVQQDGNRRPRTARDSTRTTPAFVKKKVCFTQDTEGPELDGQIVGDELSSSSPNIEEQYIQQLKADILHLHNIHRQLESESDNNGDRFSRSTGTQEPNHVKNLLLHRDTKAFLGWSSQDVKQDIEASSSSASIQTRLLRYNYSSDSAQLTAAKAGLEGLLADTLMSLMKFCLAHDSSGSEDKMKLIRPPTRQQNGDGPILPFANGCGTSPVSIYAGGILSVLQQTEVLKRTMLASTGEKKNLVKMIADKDAQLSQLTEQIDFFKDALARRRPRFERQKQVIVHYEEREQENAFESVDNEAVDQSTSILSAEQLARLAALEKDRVESLISMQSLEQHKNELEQQLEKANLELQGALDRLDIAEQQHQEALTVANKTFQEQVAAMGKQATDLQSSLTSLMERHRSLEESSAQEKSQLRRDKQELERLIRRKESEVGQRQTEAAVKAEAQAQSATAQLQLVTKQFNQTKEALRGLQLELKAAQTDNKQIQGTIRSLHHDLKVRNEDVNTLASKLSAAQAIAESKTALLQQTEVRIEAGSKEIEHQRTLFEEQAKQLQLLEAKLSRSVPVDDEELQSRQQREETAWHQRVSALEHALVAERQNTSLFREQQRKAVVMEQEKAVHAVEQAQAVAAELATANLCLLERKRQREQEQTAFEQKLKAYVDRVAELSSDKDGLERELDTLRSQYENLERSKLQSEDEAAAEEKKLQEELATVKEELKNLTEIRENLDKALAHALATPRGKSVRHQASLSEARAELQKAKHKIAALEEQLSRSGNIRTTEIDGKLAQLSARERRVAEEQRGLKKQRADATAERRDLQKERAEQLEAQEAVESKQKTDHNLLREIIVLLAQRLRVMTALFKTEPVPALPNSESKDLAAAHDVESWREMQQHWETLHQELLAVDWKLEDMRIQLEALHLEYTGDSVGKHQPSRSEFHGPNPFSDAVAAGRDTVPVAEQLKASLLLRRLSCPRQVEAEEHETFALALAREMAAMKQGYEKQVEELRGELCKTQQLRLLTSQRLRAELATERTRRQQIVEQLTQRIEELEEALREQEKALAVAQTQQEEILDQYAAATCHDERERTLRELMELVGGEQRRRERERLSKLLSYCGASSVTVEHRDRTVEEETVDEVLARLDGVDEC